MMESSYDSSNVNSNGGEKMSEGGGRPNTSSLLASLTGDDLSPVAGGGGGGVVADGNTGGGGGEDPLFTVMDDGKDVLGSINDDEEESDLFGKIEPSVPPTEANASGGGGGGGSAASRLLEGSGLLDGGAGGSGVMAGIASSSLMGGSSGGLFDEVDAAEELARKEEQRRKEAERLRRIQEENEAREAQERLRQKLAAEQAAKLQAEKQAAAAAATAAAAQAAQAAQAQAQAQAGMQNLNLNQGMPHENMPMAFANNQNGMFTGGATPLQPGQPQLYPTPQQQPHMQQPHVQQQSPQMPQQQPNPLAGTEPNSFYRTHDPLTSMHSTPQVGYGSSSYYYSTTGASQHLQSPNAAMAGTVTQPSRGRYGNVPPAPNAPATLGSGMILGSSGGNLKTQQRPNVYAGLHNGRAAVPPSPAMTNQPRTTTPETASNPASAAAPPPSRHHPPFVPVYGKVTVAEPLLVQGSGLFAGPPHWTYAVSVRVSSTTDVAVPNDGSGRGQLICPTVRRRFRHFCALEDRLREHCPGVILPARPDKHPTRAIEEASARQSAQFAAQRASELETYLNALVHHPVVGRSADLRLFLTLQDHIGTAWPEVSSSTLTRLGAVVTDTSVKVAEGTSNVIQELGADQQAAGEDNAELLALAASEGLRIGSVVQAVPKIEGTVSLVRELGERFGVVGLEMSRLVKEVQESDRELSVPLEIFSSALLRNGRRTKRLALELSAAGGPFISQYRLCRYERMAFADRRAALAKRMVARKKAEQNSQKLMIQQGSLQSMGRIGQLERLEMEVSISDEISHHATQAADEIGLILQREVSRVSNDRFTGWSGSLKIMAGNMKEAFAERAAIWESALEQFHTEFPDIPISSSVSANLTQAVPAPAVAAVPSTART